MKKLLVLLIGCLISSILYGQTTPVTRIHFFNGMAGVSADIKTTANQLKPITIKSRTWAIFQTTADSLGFMVNNKPYFIHFAPGKQYYFVIALGNLAGSHAVVSETSEREFILTASLNSAKGPEEYSL